jgi:hypothetical protein
MTPLAAIADCRIVLRLGAVAVLLAVASPPLAAQQRQTAPVEAPAAEPQPAQPEVPAPRRPGLLDAIGDALSLKGAQDAIGDLNRKAGDAARDAAKAATDITRIPSARMASGRILCTVAANGAPDCGAAANALCKAQGFNGGSSLGTESGEKCPARVYLSGRAARPGECRTETFVISAMCQ